MSVVLNLEKEKIFNHIHQQIDKSNKITITTHVNPDGDAIGSVLGLYNYLIRINKECKIIIHSPVPYNFKFLEGAKNIIQYSNEFDDFILSSDLIFVVDLNDIDRTKSPAEIIKKSKAKKVVIDHHINPKKFADIYLVDENATSAGELVYYMLKFNKKFVFNQPIAESLYSAIMTDTGIFRFPRTDGNIHRIIADLIDSGADPVMLFEKIYNTRPARVMKLFGEAFAGLEILLNGRLCVMTLSKKEFQKAGAVNEDVEDIVEQSLTIEGIQVGVLLSEVLNSDEIRASFRSKGDIFVRDIAVKFNGGGHQHAAGARFYNTSLEKAKDLVVDEIKKLF